MKQFNLITAYPIIVFIGFAVLEVLRHWIIIELFEKSPRKWLSLLIRTIVALTVILLWEWRQIEVIFFAYGLTGWFIHDYLLNLMRGVKPIWYLNNTGVLDRLQNNSIGPFYSFLMKGILLLGTLGGYFMNYTLHDAQVLMQTGWRSWLP